MKERSLHRSNQNDLYQTAEMEAKEQSRVTLMAWR